MPDGLTTVGDRVRRKRQAQAEFLANYVQGRLTATPGEHLVVIGDFNAFDANDGFVDVMNVVAGTPRPDNQTVVPGDGVDLVNPDLVNLVSTAVPPERYSAIVAGNAGNLDHVLVSAGLVTATTARRIEHPRIAADYPETHVGDAATALRFSDRDPVVAYIATDALSLTELEVTNVAAPNRSSPARTSLTRSRSPTTVRTRRRRCADRHAAGVDDVRVALDARPAGRARRRPWALAAPSPARQRR